MRIPSGFELICRIQIWIRIDIGNSYLDLDLGPTPSFTESREPNTAQGFLKKPWAGVNQKSRGSATDPDKICGLSVNKMNSSSLTQHFLHSPLQDLTFKP